MSPWKLWWDGLKGNLYAPFYGSNLPQETYKTARKKVRRTKPKPSDPDQLTNKHQDYTKQKAYQVQKKRTTLGVDNVVQLGDPQESQIDFDVVEYDGTGIALVQIDSNKNFTILKTNNNLFSYEFNQDCRITKEGDHFLLTYNGFIKDNICQLQRLLWVDEQQQHLYLSCENYCNLKYTTGIEKNWVIFNKDYFIYSMCDDIHFVKRQLPYIETTLNDEPPQKQQQWPETNTTLLDLLANRVPLQMPPFRDPTKSLSVLANRTFAAAATTSLANLMKLPTHRASLGRTAARSLKGVPKESLGPGGSGGRPSEARGSPPERTAEIQTHLNSSNNLDVTLGCPLIQSIVAYYGGKDAVFFSGGSSVVPHGDGFLMVGHTKVDHRKRKEGTSFNRFFDSEIKDKAVQKHGAYVYFMFFAEFDLNGNLTHLSNSFIPGQDMAHMPYHLVFPMGIVFHKDTYFITYGEGDVRTKVLLLSYREMNRMLLPVSEITPPSYSFHLMKSVPKKQALVLGYYGSHNSGDECFGCIWESMNSEECMYTVQDPHRITHIPSYIDEVIVGGGDLLNPYFIDRIRDLLKTRPRVWVKAVSVGIPYPQVINRPFLSLFNEIVLRNKLDLPYVQRHHPNVSAQPDLVFQMPNYIQRVEASVKAAFKSKCKALGQEEPAQPPLIEPSKEEFNIGVYLTRTMFRVGYEHQYFNLVQKFANLFVLLSEWATKNLPKPIRFHFIPMCVNPGNMKENDIELCRQMDTLLTGTSVLTHFVDQTLDIEDLVQKHKYAYLPYLYHLSKSMDMALCQRFHAHVFCLMHQVPFVSMATTRKCEQIMLEHGLEKWSVEMRLSKDFNPVDMDLTKAIEVITQRIQSMSAQSTEAKSAETQSAGA